MKKITLYLFLLALVSCSKTESDSSIVGTWEGVSFVTSIPVDENNDGIKNTDLKKEIECIAMEIDFIADGDIYKMLKYLKLSFLIILIF